MNTSKEKFTCMLYVAFKDYFLNTSMYVHGVVCFYFQVIYCPQIHKAW
jgi:hypothetical protein